MIQEKLAIPSRPIIVGNAEIWPEDDWLFFYSTEPGVGINSAIYGIYPRWLNHHEDSMNRLSAIKDQKTYVFEIYPERENKEFRIYISEIGSFEELVRYVKVIKTKKTPNDRMIVSKVANWDSVEYDLEFAEGKFIIIPDLRLNIFINNKEILNTIKWVDIIRAVDMKD